MGKVGVVLIMVIGVMGKPVIVNKPLTIPSPVSSSYLVFLITVYFCVTFSYDDNGDLIMTQNKF